MFIQPFWVWQSWQGRRAFWWTTDKGACGKEAWELYDTVTSTVITPRHRRSRCVARVISGICDFVCMCLCLCQCLRSERKTTWAINTKLGTPLLYDRTSACIDLEVKRSRVKVTGLWSVLPAWVCMSIWLLRFLVVFYRHVCAANLGPRARGTLSCRSRSRTPSWRWVQPLPAWRQLDRVSTGTRLSTAFTVYKNRSRF